MTRFFEWLFRLKEGSFHGADGWGLGLGSDYGNWVILGLVAVYLALVGVTVLSYLREGDHPRKVKLTIAALRIAALTLLMLVLLQPTLVLFHNSTQTSTVVVLLDDSLSMKLADAYAQPELRKAVAERLGVREVDLKGLPRMEIVRRLLAGADGPLAKLAKDHPLVVMRFAAQQSDYTQQLAKLEIVEADDAARIAEVFDRLEGAGYSTNLASALRDAAEKVQGQRVAALVLVSDGQNTHAMSPEQRLGATLAYVRPRMPLYAIAVGDPVPPRNAALVQLQGPSEARRGSFIEFTAYIANRNCGGQSALLRLLRQKVGQADWGDTGVTQKVDLRDAGDPDRSEPQQETVRVKAEDLGEYVYKALLEPLEGEFSDEDNAASAKVKVSDEKVRILFIAGDAGWEFQYLRNYLLRSPDRYAVSVWQQNAETDFNQEASTGMRLQQLPRTRADLYKYEVILLYDPVFVNGSFDAEFVGMLEEFVSNHHGGMCYMAGNKYTAGNLAAAGPFNPLADLLPVVLDQRGIDIVTAIHRGEPRPWPLGLTDVGLEHSMTRMAPTPAGTQQVFALLPGIFWTHPIRAIKPLAVPLALSTDPASRSTQGSDPYAPVVAVQYYGKGRVAYLGTDETWRWRAVEEGRFYEKFWENTVDFLAAGRLQNKRIIVSTGADRFSVGDRMRIGVEAYDRDYKPLTDETLTVTIINTATDEKTDVELSRDGRRKNQYGLYEATVPLKAIGTFRLTAKRDDPAYADDVVEKTVTVMLPQEEFRHPEADFATLQNVARDDRNPRAQRFLLIHEADRLPEIVPVNKLTSVTRQTHDIWDIPLTLLVIVALLAVEWVMRKKYNMA